MPAQKSPPDAAPKTRLAEIGPVDFVGKSARIVIQLLHGLVHFHRLGAPGPNASAGVLKARALKLNRLCVALLDHIQVRHSVRGVLPETGLLVTNHVSFLDIIFLGALKPMLFVSKAEVARWPLVGHIASSAGTLYVERSRRTDVSRVNAALRRALEAEVLVTLFPEGTSSDGSSVLPFQASLLQPAVDVGAQVTPGHLEYTGADKTRADDIAYFGERNLGPCMLALLKRRETFATLRCAPPMDSSAGRKTLAPALHAEVVRLSRERRP